MSAPDHMAYSRRGESDDPDTVTFVALAQDPVYPRPVVRGLKEASNIVLHHIQTWYCDEDMDSRVCHAACVANLGRFVTYRPWLDLAETYEEHMTPQQADIWQWQLNEYLTGHGYEKGKA